MNPLDDLVMEGELITNNNEQDISKIVLGLNYNRYGSIRSSLKNILKHSQEAKKLDYEIEKRIKKELGLQGIVKDIGEAFSTKVFGKPQVRAEELIDLKINYLNLVNLDLKYITILFEQQKEKLCDYLYNIEKEREKQYNNINTLEEKIKDINRLTVKKDETEDKELKYKREFMEWKLKKDKNDLIRKYGLCIKKKQGLEKISCKLRNIIDMVSTYNDAFIGISENCNSALELIKNINVPQLLLIKGGIVVENIDERIEELKTLTEKIYNLAEDHAMKVGERFNSDLIEEVSNYINGKGQREI